MVAASSALTIGPHRPIQESGDYGPDCFSWTDGIGGSSNACRTSWRCRIGQIMTLRWSFVDTTWPLTAK